MNVLFVCASNKDRSPALQNYFQAKYPTCHKFKSAGVNKYFCAKHGTHLITQEDVDWANLIVFCEKIHQDVMATNFKITGPSYTFSGGLVTHNRRILDCGEYIKGSTGEEDYLMRAEEKLLKTLEDSEYFGELKKEDEK